MRIDDIFEIDANELWAKRENAIKVHKDNIRAAGNEVEKSFNEWLSRVLPNSISVTSGHIIGKNQEISPQIDTIITDIKNISSLYTTKDGTNYVPISSVYAVGEIKSSYSHQANKSGDTYMSKFIKNKELIDTKLGHVLENNTFYGGLTDDTCLDHIVFNSTSPWMNKIFHFLFCFSKGDAKIEKLKEEFKNNEKNYLPNITVMMDSFSIYYCIDEDKVEKYPEKEDCNGRWILNPMSKNIYCSQMANNLGFFYYFLMQHINNSLLNDRTISPYFENFLKAKKSTIITLD